MSNPEIMPDASEVVHHDTPGIGLYIRRGRLSDFPDFRATCHWHNDLEFIYVRSGQMDYAIDGQIVSLREGDSLFVNSRRLHYGFGPPGRDCAFICILVEPQLLSANERLYRELIAPFVASVGKPWMRVARSEQGPLASHLQEVWRLKETAPRAYLLRAVGELTTAVAELMEMSDAYTAPGSDTEDTALAALKKMVAFIQSNYGDELTLDTIAQSAAVSRSTCCRLFQTYVHSSPGQFLNDYRLRLGRDLLVRTDKRVTQIASECGFNSAGYFTRQFHERFACTPREYRRGRAGGEKENPPPVSGDAAAGK